MKAIVKLRKEYLETREIIELENAELGQIYKDDEREQWLVEKKGKLILEEKQKVKNDNFKMTAKVEIDLSSYDCLISGEKGYGAMKKADVAIVDEEMEKVIDKLVG